MFLSLISGNFVVGFYFGLMCRAPGNSRFAISSKGSYDSS